MLAPAGQQRNRHVIDINHYHCVAGHSHRGSTTQDRGKHARMQGVLHGEGASKENHAVHAHTSKQVTPCLWKRGWLEADDGRTSDGGGGGVVDELVYGLARHNDFELTWGSM